MTTHEENDIIATIMIQNDVSYQTAIVLLLMYRDIVLHQQKTDAILHKIIKSAFDEIQQLNWMSWRDDQKSPRILGLLL